MEHERELLERLIIQGASPDVILQQSQKLDRLIIEHMKGCEM